MKSKEPQPPARCRLIRSVRAVKLEELPGSKLRSPTGNLVELPAEAVLELEGEAAPTGLSTVLWNGEAFSVFYEDLRENGVFHEGDGSAG